MAKTSADDPVAVAVEELTAAAEGAQCAVYRCTAPGTGFNDKQWWICREHYEAGY